MIRLFEYQKILNTVKKMKYLIVLALFGAGKYSGIIFILMNQKNIQIEVKSNFEKNNITIKIEKNT